MQSCIVLFLPDSNSNGSYYYKNDNGSTYYNNGNGGAPYKGLTVQHPGGDNYMQVCTVI